MTFDCQTNMKQTDSLTVTSSEFAQFCVHRCNRLDTLGEFSAILRKEPSERDIHYLPFCFGKTPHLEKRMSPNPTMEKSNLEIQR